MKVCTVEHHAPRFGLIPVGSLWADDSPFATADDCFADVETVPTLVVKSQPVRKFAQQKGDAS